MKDDSLYCVEMLSFHPFSLLNLPFCSFFFTKVDIYYCYNLYLVYSLMYFSDCLLVLHVFIMVLIIIFS